jgi:hypothetical protein
VHASPITWLTRLLWLTLPLTLGDLVAAALEGRSTPVTVTATVLAWGLWAAGLLASLVRAPWALLVMRLVMPLAVVAGVAAAVAADSTPGALGWLGLATAAVAAVACCTAEVGYECINGAAYGDEARFPLRPPAVLLLGPIGLVWALTAVPLPAGLLALAARWWVAGALLVVLGSVAAWWGLRVLTRLTRRWCVFVPAGITLVDDMALADPTLMRSVDVVAIGPAPADTTALDLTAGASGLIVQVDLNGAGDFVPAAPRGGVTEAVRAASVLIAPSRPGALLRHARERRIGVVSDPA